MFQTSFQLTLPHGTCVGVSLPSFTHFDEAWLSYLTEKERILCAPFAPRRKITFIGGRIALRTALKTYGCSNVSIERTDRGAPVVPSSFVGSISHKDTAAIAIASPGSDSIGVDLELPSAFPLNVAKHIFTDREMVHFQDLPPKEQPLYACQVFSLKEALYKSIDPLLRRYVGFKEVGIVSQSNSRFAFEFSFNAPPGRLQAEGFVHTQDEWIISTVRTSLYSKLL